MTKVQMIREELEDLAEPSYRLFMEKLVPGCDNLLGVRIPIIKKIAKRLAKEMDTDYLASTDILYFEEVMLRGIMIGNLKVDLEERLSYMRAFIPLVNNWSLCDSFCNELKIVRKHREEVWEFLTPYFHSEHTYDVRVGVVMILCHYIEQDYLEQIFQVFDTIKHPDYYVKMAVAWAIATAFTKFPEETMVYLKNNKLDDDTYHKALQKIRESTKVEKEMKETIKGMRRK